MQIPGPQPRLLNHIFFEQYPDMYVLEIFSGDVNNAKIWEPLDWNNRI